MTGQPARWVRRCRGDAGTGLVASIAGVIVFLCLVLFATEALVNLSATSTVTAAAYDAARRVAAADGTATSRAAAVVAAEQHARALLGHYGDDVEFEWDITGDQIALTIRADNPDFQLPWFSGALAFDRVERTVRVRAEELQ